MAQPQVIIEEKERAAEIPLLPESALDAVIRGFAPTSLSEMDSVALLSRMDTKYILSTSQLLAALRNLRQQYRILTINGRRAHHYRTLYFDTPDFTLYHDHVTGRARKVKVREREYADTGIAYLEIKSKDVKERTDKSRLPVAAQTERLDDQMRRFVGGFLPEGEQLEPKLWNIFRRITLVSYAQMERLTIDVDLVFDDGQRCLTLDGIAIAEVKRGSLSRGSAFAAEMRRLGVRETGFSKYCFGVSQLSDCVKKNSQKEKVLLIAKQNQRGIDYVCYA
ncbi:MAG TPA: polyphosphate polymerase domain-containing protein [Anaerolineaceae bacterium]